MPGSRLRRGHIRKPRHCEGATDYGTALAQHEENAEFSKALVAPKAGERWLLVTSAFHMPRSVGLFRKAGFAVEPYPVDWRAGGRGDLVAISPIAVDGLERTDIAVREWIGLIAYWATGKIDELFPGPTPN